jgi:hypothetical protein
MWSPDRDIRGGPPSVRVTIEAPTSPAAGPWATRPDRADRPKTCLVTGPVADAHHEPYIKAIGRPRGSATHGSVNPVNCIQDPDKAHWSFP